MILSTCRRRPERESSSKIQECKGINSGKLITNYISLMAVAKHFSFVIVLKFTKDLLDICSKRLTAAVVDS